MIAGLAAGFAAVAVLPFAGTRWWVLDLAGAFRPQYLAVCAVLGLLAAALRRRWPALVLGAAAAVNLAVLWPYLTGVTVPPPEGAPTLEVVSFNVGISNPHRDEVVVWLAAEAPDVAVLVESSFEWEDAVRRAGLGYAVVAVVPPTRLAGITVLVRPEHPARVVDGLPIDVSNGVAVEVGVGDAAVEILALHPPSPTSAARAARRDAVLEAAGDWVAGREMPTLVVGDLNATPWSQAVRALTRAAGLTNTLEGRGLQPTWPAGWGPLMIPIDQALVTDGLAVAGRRTGPSLGSAHRPLVVTVALTGGPGD